MLKVSVVTVAYNSEQTIKETIDSVVGQDYPHIEYIIIDGKSSDKTLEIVKSFGDKISVVVSEKDNGIYDAINKGITLATGDIVVALNSDDFYANNKVISKVVETFNATGALAVYGDLNYVDRVDHNKIIRKWKAGIYKEGLFLKGWMPPHPTFFVRKSCYQNFGIFNLKLRSAADYELMLRFIHKHKIKVSYLPQLLVNMRAGGQSNITFKNRFKANREDKMAWEMNGLKPGLLTLIRKPLSKLKQYL